MSTVLWLMAVPFTVAAAGSVEALAAGFASFAGLHALMASNDTALARRSPDLINLIESSLGMG
jgi:hypothetical protein